MATVSARAFDSAGRPVDGLVVIHRPGRTPFSCRTVAGRCEIQNVPSGDYRVSFQPTRGAAPPPRALQVRPGRMVLTFRAGAARRPVTRAAQLQREVNRLRVENMVLKARLRRC